VAAAGAVDFDRHVVVGGGAPADGILTLTGCRHRDSQVVSLSEDWP